MGHGLRAQNLIHPRQSYVAAQGVLAGRVILVTGASGGIGAALAEACGRLGAQVVLTGRKVKKLEAVYDVIVAAGGPQPAAIALDLATAVDREFETLAGMLRPSVA